MSANASVELRGFRILLSRRLLAWSLASLAVGALLQFLASGFWRAFGIQALAWGGVDALIALAGLAGARRRAERTGRSASQQSDGLRKLLWINTLLDLLYVAAGIGLALLAGGRGPAWRGHGWGVALQGAFLLFFDLIHAQSVPAPIREPLQAFSGPEHLPFRLDGAPGGPGALLVHGFPGTPAEMRHLAETLHREGWSVQALLLPGFGPQITRIAGYRWQDWRQAVQQALRQMRREHNPLLLAGYSLGAALSAGAVAHAAAAGRPDGLALLAPFWRLGSPLQRLAGRLLAPFLPRTFQPLAKADFADPRLLESLRQFLPGMDLEDEAVRQQLREASMPVTIIREILACGRSAFRRGRAGHLDLPTLVIQGRNDTIVRSADTRRLLRRLGGSLRYREVEAGHDLVDPRTPGWLELTDEVKGFAVALRAAETEGER